MVERDRNVAALVRVQATCVVDQYLAHRAGRDREEFDARQPRRIALQLEPGLVHERGGIDRRRAVGTAAFALRDAMQLGIGGGVEGVPCKAWRR